MCIMSQAVDRIENTRIFARSENGSQFLVYSMNYAAATDLAMVLPLPVPLRPADDAVRFIDLHRYSEFFEHLRRGFPEDPIPRSRGSAVEMSASPRLHVHRVGDFEASFVPQIKDFERLDARFRLPSDVWDQLPEYRDYGFAVFKLKGGSATQGDPATRRVHPMAFTFPQRNPELLYFPTLHVHDRDIHPYADFDHELYCQPDAMTVDHLDGWTESADCASEFMIVTASKGVIAPQLHCWRRRLRGTLENRDSLVGSGGKLPARVSI